VKVAGPTLDDDYSNVFGSVRRPADPLQTPDPICTLYSFSDTTVHITVASVTVDAPFTTTTDCAGTGVPDGPSCSVGTALAAVQPLEAQGEAIGCQFGIVMTGDASANYESHDARLTFSAVCTSPGAEGTPCGDSKVTDRQPSPSAPVPVTWDALSVTVPLRYCGATEYADADGQPITGQPAETPAAYGCT
jgi:hypothetical protein